MVKIVDTQRRYGMVIVAAMIMDTITDARLRGQL